MNLEIYSHDIKLLIALISFKNDNEAHKIVNCLDSLHAKLVAKYILDPSLSDEHENEYSCYAKQMLEQYS